MNCTQCEQLPATLNGLVGWIHFHTPTPCWELLRMIYRAHLGIELPYANVLETKDQWARLIQEGLARWVRVDDPVPYDGVLLRAPKLVDHIGLMITPTEFVHVPRRIAGVVRSRLADYRDRDHLVGIYRYLNP